MIPAPIWTPTREEYYHDPSWHYSMLKCFEWSPRLALSQFKDRSVPRPSTPAMRKGLALAEYLEHGWGKGVVHTPCKTAYGKEWTKYCEEHPDKIVVTKPEGDAAFAMYQAIACDPSTPSARFAFDLLFHKAAIPEYCAQWDEEGLPMKGRFDCVTLIEGDGTDRIALLDVKSTWDPSPRGFKDSVVKFGYDMQAYLYRHAAQSLFGEAPPWLWVAVRSEPPYEVAVYQASDALLGRAAERVRPLLARAAQCGVDGLWTAPWEREVQVIE